MKAYMFNTENGLYEGETYVADDTPDRMDGVTAVAPPAYESGTVPVFDMPGGQWVVIPVSLFKKRYMGERTNRGHEHV